ncbi:613_t:CDS:1 [Funneliformis geosporum]|uniref:12762_t:CDS:1 n=1 Tax=Funneliformis geosporum TaxID=1117311 RepID=A0A9W4WJ55_9GLOM|nr:613_t:CDS:1 [Funneliformis geosporum]CAI2165711.1 12762_t:CDS:1 [Funneliformis geosporum]
MSARPPFPPTLTARDLIPAEINNGIEAVRTANAFIAYRMALVRELKLQRVPCHRSNVSSHASRLWAEEPEEVKDVYRKMATDAQLLYNKTRGITFLYEQPIPNGKCKIESETQSSSTQVFEEKILSTKNPQYEAPTQQGNFMLNPPPPSVLDQEQSMYYDNSVESSSNVSVPSNIPTFDHNLAGLNSFGENVFENTRNAELEQRIQVLENQLAFFYQMYFGGYNNYPA